MYDGALDCEIVAANPARRATVGRCTPPTVPALDLEQARTLLRGIEADAADPSYRLTARHDDALFALLLSAGPSAGTRASGRSGSSARSTGPARSGSPAWSPATRPPRSWPASCVTISCRPPARPVSGWSGQRPTTGRSSVRCSEPPAGRPGWSTTGSRRAARTSRPSPSASRGRSSTSTTGSPSATAYYTRIETIDTDLQAFLRLHNFERPHGGYRTRGRTPAGIFFSRRPDILQQMGACDDDRHAA